MAPAKMSNFDSLDQDYRTLKQIWSYAQDNLGMPASTAVIFAPNDNGAMYQSPSSIPRWMTLDLFLIATELHLAW